MKDIIDCPCCDGDGQIFTGEGPKAGLIAAAPELLEAARFAIWHIVGVLSQKDVPKEMRDSLMDAQDQLKSAIAKAEGEEK